MEGCAALRTALHLVSRSPRCSPLATFYPEGIRHHIRFSSPCVVMPSGRARRESLPPSSSSIPPSSSSSWPPSSSSLPPEQTHYHHASHVSGWNSSSPTHNVNAAHETVSHKHSPDKDYPSDDHSLLAAIIVPIAIVCLAIVGLLFFLSRRRRIQRRSAPSAANTPVSAMEMASSGPNNDIRAHRIPPNVTFTPATAPPVILSDRVNNAYLTGLDTSSQGSASRPVSYGDFDDNPARRSLGGTFLEPPPPYKTRSQADADEEDEEEPPYEEYETVPLEESTDPMTALHRARSPFADPYEDEDEPVVADGLQYRRNPFADPETRMRFGRRGSEDSEG